MLVFREMFFWCSFCSSYIYALQFMTGACGYVKLGFLENEFSDLVAFGGCGLECTAKFGLHLVDVI